MEKLNFCTIATKARLAHVKVFAESLLLHHPGANIYFLLVDNIENYFDPLSLKINIELIEVSALKNLPNITEFFFKYNAFEASTALKPFFCEHLFKTYNIKKLIYLDSDIYLTTKMDELDNLLETYSIILTPHITKQLPLDGFQPDEIAFLKAGVFNTGLIGISNTQETLNFLTWWKKRLWLFGISSVAEGLFADQKWIDLVPSLFDKVYILKNPGYNVAHWNLHERKFSFSGERIFVNSNLLKCFHFSGFNPYDIESISKYQTRYKLANFPELRGLFELYKKLLLENGYNKVCSWPYSYNFFDNGSKIPDQARRVYWSLGDKAKKFGNPFATGKKNAYEKYFLKNFPMKYKSIDKMIEFGKKYKKILNKFPRLEIQVRKFYAFFQVLKNVNDFNFFKRK